MKKTLAAALAVATIGTTMAVSTAPAQAWYRGGWGRGAGWGVGAGVLGGLAAGALIAGATRPAYGYGAPVYEDAPACYIQRRKVWLDPEHFTFRNVRVCE